MDHTGQRVTMGHRSFELEKLEKISINNNLKISNDISSADLLNMDLLTQHGIEFQHFAAQNGYLLLKHFTALFINQFLEHSSIAFLEISTDKRNGGSGDTNSIYEPSYRSFAFLFSA